MACTGGVFKQRTECCDEFLSPSFPDGTRFLARAPQNAAPKQGDDFASEIEQGGKQENKG